MVNSTLGYPLRDEYSPVVKFKLKVRQNDSVRGKMLLNYIFNGKNLLQVVLVTGLDGNM